MFGDIVDPSITLGTRRWYTVPLSLVIHTAAIVGVIVIPLVATDVLPDPRQMISAFAVTPPPPSPPPAAPRATSQPAPAVVVNPDAAPVAAPAAIAPEVPVDTRFETIATGTGVIPGSVASNIPGALPAPPPPQPAAPIRVGGAIRPPVKTHHVNPQYPPIAQAAGVSGIVIVEAMIGADGRVVDAKVLRSVPLLDQAALDAVRQWEFTPTLLNGVPTPVIMTVTVQFALNR
jgi:protein TonB